MSLDIYAEAYYQALKRVKEEKDSRDEAKGYKWYENVGFFMNFILFPWKLRKKYKLKNNVYDNMVVLVISWVLYILGFISWFLGICGIIAIVKIIKEGMEVLSVLVAISMVIFLLLWGSLMTVSAKQFSEEREYDRIYAFSSIILAIASCIISIIALTK